jgi:hypothetical protein
MMTGNTQRMTTLSQPSRVVLVTKSLSKQTFLTPSRSPRSSTSSCSPFPCSAFRALWDRFPNDRGFTASHFLNRMFRRRLEQSIVRTP